MTQPIKREQLKRNISAEQLARLQAIAKILPGDLSDDAMIGEAVKAFLAMVDTPATKRKIPSIILMIDAAKAAHPELEPDFRLNDAALSDKAAGEHQAAATALGMADELKAKQKGPSSSGSGAWPSPQRRPRKGRE